MQELLFYVHPHQLVDTVSSSSARFLSNLNPQARKPLTVLSKRTGPKVRETPGSQM